MRLKCDEVFKPQVWLKYDQVQTTLIFFFFPFFRDVGEKNWHTLHCLETSVDLRNSTVVIANELITKNGFRIEVTDGKYIIVTVIPFTTFLRLYYNGFTFVHVIQENCFLVLRVSL